jgi:hypothetical protein
LKEIKNIMIEKYKILRNEGLPHGRMLCYSKSEYRDANPNSVIYFNANVLTVTDGKIWYGDLDLTNDAEALKRVADELGEPLFVLKELDCRFGDELKPITELIALAVWNTTLETPFQ